MIPISADGTEVSRVAGVVAGHIQRDRLTTIVIGNGLSLESGGPTTDTLKRRVAEGLEKEIYETLSGHPPSRSGDSRALFRKYALEEVCYAAIKGSTLTRGELHKRLQKSLIRKDGNALRPSLGHEVIAHLADKNLVHVIVDFNFDDILVDVLRDELGLDQVHVAFNESDFSAYLRQIEQEPMLQSRPLVIKPHGWVRDPHGIRITKDTVHRYGTYLHKLLRTIYEKADVVVIAGYSANDPDFKQHLSDMAPFRAFEDKKVVWVEKKLACPRTIRAAKRLMGDSCTLLLGTDASSFFSKLGDECAQRHRIPGVTRHRIRCTITDVVNDDRLVDTRFLLEILMLAAKARGLFGEEALGTCARLSTYLAKLEEGGLDKPATLMRMLLDSNVLKRTLRHGEHCYTCTPTHLGTATTELLSAWVTGSLDARSLDVYFADLAHDFDTDVSHDRTSVLPLRFAHAVPIETMRELEDRTEEVLAGDELRISSERGEWLTSDRWSRVLNSKGSSVRVLLVGDPGPPHTYYRERQEEAVHKLKALGVEVRSLRNAAHALHITMNEKRKAIVFRRRWREPSISPYWIDRTEDQKEVRLDFNRMWHRGKRA